MIFLSRIEPIKGFHSAIAMANAVSRHLLIPGNRVETGSVVGYWDQKIAAHIGKEGKKYVGTVNDEQKINLLSQAAAMIVPIK